MHFFGPCKIFCTAAAEISSQNMPASNENKKKWENAFFFHFFIFNYPNFIQKFLHYKNSFFVEQKKYVKLTPKKVSAKNFHFSQKKKKMNTFSEFSGTIKKCQKWTFFWIFQSHEKMSNVSYCSNFQWKKICQKWALFLKTTTKNM